MKTSNSVRARLVGPRNAVWSELITVALSEHGEPPDALESPQDSRGITADGRWDLTEHGALRTTYTWVERD